MKHYQTDVLMCNIITNKDPYKLRYQYPEISLSDLYILLPKIYNGSEKFCDCKQELIEHETRKKLTDLRGIAVYEI